MLMPTQIPVYVSHTEPMIRRGITATLGDDCRFQVAEAASDYAALGGQPFVGLGLTSVLVTNLMGGIEAATALRGENQNRRPLAHVAVLVVAPVDNEMNVRGAIQAGVSGFLPQSCEAEQLKEATCALARGQRYLDRSVAECLAGALVQELPTPREAAVLQLMASGLCNKAIAAQLCISAGTVKAHIKALLQKLGAATRTEAADVAKRRGLLDPLGAELAFSLGRRRHSARGSLQMGARAV
jgi:DNA-binding NarL/FixJ family response regulator